MTIISRAASRGGALLGALALASILPASGQAGQAAQATPLPAACGFVFPSSHNLRVVSVGSGMAQLVRLAAGGYSFDLRRLAGFNDEVHMALGLTPPRGDSVVPFVFNMPGGHAYVGLTNVVAQGTQLRVCLPGVAYRDLGNGPNADRVPPVAVTLTGLLGKTSGRVDLYVGATHYYVSGAPRVLQ